MTVADACDCIYICACEFHDEILLREEECKTRVNLNFSKKNKGANMVNCSYNTA